MSGQPEQERGPEELNDEGVGMGMSEDGNTFEPEEDPDAVDEPAGGAGGGGTHAYEEEVSASLQAMGEEPPSELSYDEDALVQESTPLPDELREVEVGEDDSPAHRL